MEKIPRLNSDQRSNLVAYLDGELPEPAAKEIEHVLSKSPTVQHDVEMLSRTWDLLDQLPRLAGTSDLTTRMVSVVKSRRSAQALLARELARADSQGAVAPRGDCRRLGGGTGAGGGRRLSRDKPADSRSVRRAAAQSAGDRETRSRTRTSRRSSFCGNWTSEACPSMSRKRANAVIPAAARIAAGGGASGRRPLERSDDRGRQRARIAAAQNRDVEPTESQPAQAELRDLPQAAAGAPRAVGPACTTSSSRTPRTAAICKSCWTSTTRGCSSFRHSTGTSCSARPTPGNAPNWCKSSAEEQKQRVARAARARLPVAGPPL